MFLGLFHKFCRACWGVYLTSVYLLRAVQYTDGKVFFIHIPTTYEKYFQYTHMIYLWNCQVQTPVTKFIVPDQGI
jgi:hypothetical protein